MVLRTWTSTNITTSGRLDPLIWRDLCEYYKIAPEQAGHDSFRAFYGKELARLIEVEQPVESLPGVLEAVHFVRDHANATCALLTGNYPETGLDEGRSCWL